MKKLLITAFEPFNGMDLNSSSMVLEAMPDELNNVKLRKIILPVLYKEAFDTIKNEIKKLDPDFVICMGQAGGRNRVTVEKIAVNINSSKTGDGRGVVKENELINPKGEPAYFTTLPIKKMLESVKSEDAGISYSAGTYVCNDIFYRLMQFMSATGRKAPAGFVHLPYTEHFKKEPHVEFEKQLSIIKAMICTLGEDDEQ